MSYQHYPHDPADWREDCEGCQAEALTGEPAPRAAQEPQEGRDPFYPTGTDW